MRKRTASLLACALLGAGMAKAGPFDPPDPRSYARAQDRERARLLGMPCREGDAGRGCYRRDGRLVREAPCSYPIDANSIGFLPVGQCYRMEPPRRHRGVWIDGFEGQQFIPEGASAPDWPRTGPGTPGWREQAERARLARIWIDVGRVGLDPLSRQRGARRFITFVGRKTMYPGSYGHFGMFGQEIIVDRVISMRDCPAAGVCR